MEKLGVAGLGVARRARLEAKGRSWGCEREREEGEGRGTSSAHERAEGAALFEDSLVGAKG